MFEDDVPLEKELTQLMLTIEMAKAYNNLDVSIIADRLADDLVYESQQVLIPLIGKSVVLEYLDQKFMTISNTPGAELFVELAFLDNLEDTMIPLSFARQGQPCLVMAQGNRENLLAVVLIQAHQGKIKRIDLCTVAPHWSQARRTGEYPK
jgi:hypothetical protein